MRVGALRQPGSWLGGAALAAALAAPGLGSQGRAMEGTDFARVLAPPGAVIEAYQNSGYRLERDGDEVTVYVEVSPLESRTPFALPRGPFGGLTESASLARTLVLDAESRYEAVSSILGWVSRNIRYELDRELDQSPAAVLERRSAFCTGLASLTVTLLAAVDIPAREVAGYVVEEAASGLAGYHRWVEVFYPDRGWVFSDPMTTHHYVPATYVRLARDEIDLGRGHDALLLERRNSVETADIYPYGPLEIRARRNERRQLAASVTVMVGGRVRGEAVLTGYGLRRAQPLEAGRSTFVGLRPGVYGLEVQLEGGGSFLRRLQVRGPVRASLYLPGPGQSRAGGWGR